MDQNERARLLVSAADLLDRRHTALAGAAQPPQRTPEGDIARMFAADSAKLGRPNVHRLELPKSSVDKRGTPVAVEELTRAYAYYWLEFPVSLWTRPGRGFNCLQFGVAFNDDEDEAQRPVAFDALPDQEFATRFQAESQVSLGVDTSFKFSVALPPLPLPIDGGVLGLTAETGAGADATANGKLIFGPFGCALRTPVVERTATGMDHVLWRLKESFFEQENDPGLRVVLRVPRSAERLHITAHVEATRYVNLLDAGLRGAIVILPEAIKSFFTRGTPIAASANWDMSADL